MNSLFRATHSTKQGLLLPPLHILHSHYATKSATKPKTPASKPKTLKTELPKTLNTELPKTPSVEPTTQTSEPKTPTTTYTIKTPRFTQQASLKADLPRPSEVHFQPKVANSVRLIGHVKTPLQIHTGPDDTFSVTTVLTTVPSSSYESSVSCSSYQSFRIPIAFEGDLAHIASLHVKDDVCVFVAGNLNSHEGVHQLQVKVHTLHFVQEPFTVSEKSKDSREKTIDPTVASGEDDAQTKKTTQTNERKGHQVWKELVQDPNKWWDNRLNKRNPKGPDFKHKETGEALWLKDSPEWVSPMLPPLKTHQNAMSDAKETPQAVLSELEGKGFDGYVQKSTQTTERKGDQAWKELVHDPNKWWDNRVNKRNPKAPDFKHKETGEGLWLKDSPEWVSPMLPPSKTQETPQAVLSELDGKGFDGQFQNSIPTNERRGDEAWKELVHGPDKWWDNRLNKRNPKGPDFKHKETGEVLWLRSSPEWALAMLPPLKT